MAYSQNEVASDTKASRIEHDASRIRELADRIHGSKRRLIGHARKLGYFQDTPEAGASAKISPVSSTLLDAITDLERAVEELSGSLNVFD